MKLSPRYGSHLIPLIHALGKTRGPVLELGLGAYSTPLLNAICELERRPLMSVDDNQAIVDWARERYHHQIIFVSDWDTAPIDRPWDVALIDHAPGLRRKIDIARLANYAQYIVIHDSNGRYRKEYDYASIYPLFKYQLNYDAIEPSTTILSNFVPLNNFWDHRWKTHSITF